MLVDLFQGPVEGVAVSFDDPAAQLQIFFNRHRRKNTVSLDEMGNPLSQHLVGLESLDRMSVMKHIALPGLQIAVNGLEQGRFARSVGSDDAGQAPFQGNYIDIRVYTEQ